MARDNLGLLAEIKILLLLGNSHQSLTDLFNLKFVTPLRNALFSTWKSETVIKMHQWQNKTMFLKQQNIVFECNIFTVWKTACDVSFLKHYHTPVIHFGILHFKNKETLFYSAGPISRYSRHFKVVIPKYDFRRPVKNFGNKLKLKLI